MRLRNVKNATEIINNSKYVINKPLFDNNNPIYLEIGMGKGNFIIENAKRNPNINYVGVEKYASVMCKAIEKLKGENLNNLRFILMDAKNIDEIFENKVDLLFLNFSDPWPKKRHQLRRLSSPVFLKKYDKIFKKSKHIIMKTDNRNLMEYSIVSFSNYGYVIESISLDLHNDNDVNNIETEYEYKFSSKGFPIYKVEVKK